MKQILIFVKDFRFFFRFNSKFHTKKVSVKSFVLLKINYLNLYFVQFYKFYFVSL